MSDKTAISWTDATWNPVRGCSRVSEGCRNCYAERVAVRFSGPGMPYEGLAQHVAPRDLLDRVGGRRSGWTREVRMVPGHLADPLRWKKPRRIFVNSMSDLFHEKLTNEEIAAVFGVMAAVPQHTFQILTKRAKRMREWFAWVAEQKIGDQPMRGAAVCSQAAHEALPSESERVERMRLAWLATPIPWPLPNVWLGVSVENQAAADERIPELLATPAAVRFLSCEPLIGPVNLHEYLLGFSAGHPAACACGHGHGFTRCPNYGGVSADCHHSGCACAGFAKKPGGDGLSWVIAGCESGPGARPCEVEWLRSLRDQCAAAGVAYFLKQAHETELGKCGDADNPNGDQPCGQRVTAQAISPDTAAYSCGCTVEGSELGAGIALGFGDGSKRKSGGLIELPYLDGVQHAAFPTVSQSIATDTRALFDELQARQGER